MAEKISSVEELLERAARIRSGAPGSEQRTQQALELMADALIALLAEAQRPEQAVVTSIS